MGKIHAVNTKLELASIDLNLLVVFDAILKDRSVTLAARRVGLSQPAMSSALARLRRTFNDPLFVRTKRGMLPTPYAQLLAPPIQRACELVASSFTIGKAFDPLAATRTFTFYMTDIGEGVFLPKLLRALEQRAPRVRVKVLRIPERGEQEAMAAGDVDIAIGLFPDLKAGFFQQRLYQRQFRVPVACGSPARPGSAHRQAVRGDAARGDHVRRHRPRSGRRARVRRPAPSTPRRADDPALHGSAHHRHADRLHRHRAAAPCARVRRLSRDTHRRAADRDSSPIEIKQHWHERYHHDPANKWIRGFWPSCSSSRSIPDHILASPARTSRSSALSFHTSMRTIRPARTTKRST